MPPVKKRLKKAPRQRQPLNVIDPDLAVTVAGETEMVNSLFLRINSPVFKTMLSSSMKEGLSKAVTLPGKTMEEFCLFYHHLQCSRPMEPDEALVLCAWAEEYQVDGLKGACDVTLAKDVPNAERLILACTYNLPKLLARCRQHFLQDTAHLLSLKQLVAMDGGAAALARIWPDISYALEIECDSQPSAESVKHMWPIVENLMKARGQVTNSLKRESEWRKEFGSLYGRLYSFGMYGLRRRFDDVHMEAEQLTAWERQVQGRVDAIKF